MPAVSPRQVSEAILRRVDNARRDFLKQLIAAGSFVVPAMASFSLGPGATSSAAAEDTVPTDDVLPRRVLFPVGNAILRQASPSTNEGANPLLRVGTSPVSRAVLLFDAAEVGEAFEAGPRSVHLVLKIANNHGTWGQGDDRTVDAHPLLEPFTEGNGRQLGLSGKEARRGDGPGVTWSSPEDPEVSDDKAEVTSTDWSGGQFGPATSQGVVHFNRQLGDVAWDVAADVEAGHHGWLVKVTEENGSQRPPSLGWDNAFGGTVDYHSRHAPAGQDGADRRPALVFVYASSTG